jgi:hypothetical protein
MKYSRIELSKLSRQELAIIYTRITDLLKQKLLAVEAKIKSTAKKTTVKASKIKGASKTTKK